MMFPHFGSIFVRTEASMCDLIPRHSDYAFAVLRRRSVIHFYVVFHLSIYYRRYMSGSKLPPPDPGAAPQPPLQKMRSEEFEYFCLDIACVSIDDIENAEKHAQQRKALEVLFH